jgi:integral membrane protein
MPKTVKVLYWLAFLDGLALLGLVTVGMPLKYGMDWPLLVKILGPTHGVLFIALSLTLIAALSLNLIRPTLGAIVFFGALIPGGAFYADYRLKKAFLPSTPFGVKAPTP